MGEVCQESINTIIPGIVEAKRSQLGLQLVSGGFCSHPWGHLLDKFTMEFLGITLVRASKGTRIFSHNFSSLGFSQMSSKDGKGIGLEHSKEGLFFWSNWFVTWVEHIAQTLGISNDSEASVPLVP